MANKDITHLDDIKLLVNTFYDNIRKDALLKDIFEGIIEDRWPAHLEKMYRFWQTVLLEEHTYLGSPFPPHAQMPIGPAHFARWKVLFFETVDGLFSGEVADEAKWRADKMAEMFLSKIEYYKNANVIPLT